MKAKITVIVPVYNVEEYLPSCLDSLINQTYKNIEIVCVNDGSTDGSGEILKDYTKKDQRIKVINKKNGGLSSARNAALEKCNTEYVMFCDSDDSFNEKMCEKMVYAIEKDGSDIAVCDTNVIYSAHEEMRESDEQYYDLKYKGKKMVTDDVILNTNVSVSNKIFKMEIIRKNELTFPEGLNNEDFYFYNIYMSYASDISFVKEKLYNYERRDGSIMSENFEKDKLSLDHLKIAEKIFKVYKKSGFLVKHTDLFWAQWRNSYWFSFEHTSLNMRGRVFDEGKAFMKKYLENYPPKNDDLKSNIKWTFANKLVAFLKRGARRVTVGMYEKINIGYRQQKYINYNIRRLQKKYDDLSERLDRMINEEIEE